MRSLLNRLMVAFGDNTQLCRLAGREIKLQRAEIIELKLELKVSKAAGSWEPESHWDNHPVHESDDWELEVTEGVTRQSYVEWVNSRLEDEDED